MKFNKEPVAWLTLILVLAQLGIGVLTDNIDTSAFTALTTAVGGVVIRQTVSPSKYAARVDGHEE